MPIFRVGSKRELPSIQRSSLPFFISKTGFQSLDSPQRKKLKEAKCSSEYPSTWFSPQTRQDLSRNYHKFWRTNFSREVSRTERWGSWLCFLSSWFTKRMKQIFGIRWPVSFPSNAISSVSGLRQNWKNLKIRLLGREQREVWWSSSMNGRSLRCCEKSISFCRTKSSISKTTKWCSFRLWTEPFTQF